MSTVLTLVLVPAIYELFYARRGGAGMRRIAAIAGAAWSCGARAGGVRAARGRARGRRRRVRRSRWSARERARRHAARITLPGDLVGLNEAALYAKVTGYLKRIDVDKGDWVRKGQMLAEIEVPELEQKLKRARANLEVQRVTCERLQRVWTTDQRLVAREDVDVAQGKFEQAQAEVEELEALVGYTHIVAPFDGVVTGALRRPRRADPGQARHAASTGDRAAAAPTPVVSIADIDTLRVYVYVPEEETSLIKRGMTGHAAGCASSRGASSPARWRASPTRSTSRRAPCSPRSTSPTPDHELYPGMYADVTLELERHPDALTVPATAVGIAGAARFVYVVRDGELAKVPVTTGISEAGSVEIVVRARGTRRRW